jgi:hypothetical protein
MAPAPLAVPLPAPTTAAARDDVFVVPVSDVEPLSQAIIPRAIAMKNDGALGKRGMKPRRQESNIV